MEPVSAPVGKVRKAAAVGTGYSGSTLDKVRVVRDSGERGIVKRGKKEVPAPEPVRAVAREAREERQGDRRGHDRRAVRRSAFKIS